jgi:hypothetical protein
MSKNIMKKRFNRLKAIRWGSAREWNPAAWDRLLEYYERVLPVWPEDRMKLLPHNRVLTEPFSNRLSAMEGEQVNSMLQAILKIAEDSGVVLTAINSALVKLILACAALLERGDLASCEDPSESLLQLFELGFDLSPSHSAVDICYQIGCTSVPLPDRKSVAHRATSQTFDPT